MCVFINGIDFIGFILFFISVFDVSLASRRIKENKAAFSRLKAQYAYPIRYQLHGTFATSECYEFKNTQSKT